MALFSIHFSPTGGTQKVMELLSEGLKEQPRVIDLSDAEYDFSKVVFAPQDVCLIGVPSFGGRVPVTALTRLQEMKAEGASAVLVTTYGNRAYDDTLLELSDAAQACGFRITAAVAAVTEHSIMRQFGSGRPDSADETELRSFSEQIYRTIGMGQASEALSLPGNRPFRDYNGVPFKPKAGRDCTGCGLCAGLCPVGAIPRSNPGETDASVCISCMRCIAICPSHARSLNKVMLLAASTKMKKAFDGRKPNELFLAKGTQNS